jgi:hypothetical protein
VKVQIARAKESETPTVTSTGGAHELVPFGIVINSVCRSTAYMREETFHIQNTELNTSIMMQAAEKARCGKFEI